MDGLKTPPPKSPGYYVDPIKSIYQTQDQSLPKLASKVISGEQDITETIQEQTDPPGGKKPCLEELNENSQLSAQDIKDNSDEVRASRDENEPAYKSLSTEEKIKLNFKKLGGTPEAIDQALCIHKKFIGKSFSKKPTSNSYSGNITLKNKKYMVVQDLTLPSNQMRYFLINLEDDPENNKQAGDVEAYLAPVGGGIDKPGCPGAHDPSEPENKLFSNKPGCHLMPRGALITADNIDSSDKAWKKRLDLHGIQKDVNDNSFSRTTYFHPATNLKGQSLLDDDFATSLEHFPKTKLNYSGGDPILQGFTQGCTGVHRDHWDEIAEKVKGGALQYNFTDTEKSFGKNYCGDESFMELDQSK